MSTYDEKQITFHAVEERGCDFEPFANYWFEVRMVGTTIGKGYTLEEAIENCPDCYGIQFDFREE